MTEKEKDIKLAEAVRASANRLAHWAKDTPGLPTIVYFDLGMIIGRLSKLEQLQEEHYGLGRGGAHD